MRGVKEDQIPMKRFISRINIKVKKKAWMDNLSESMSYEIIAQHSRRLILALQLNKIIKRFIIFCGKGSCYVRARITIREVALRSGVSIGTVSNVLNNVPSVGKSIRRRVLRVIRDLNYEPNRVAKSLVSGHTQTLAFIIPDICNPFFPEMVQGASDKASAHDYNLFLGNIGKYPKRETEYIRDFVSQGVDGLIIATSDYSKYGPEEQKQIRDLRIPIVMVDRNIPGLELDLVCFDNVRCAQIAVTHLVNSGYRKIGMILGPIQTMTARERLEGGSMILQERGLCRQELIKCGEFTLESGFQIMCSFLKNRNEVDAVFCANDMIAIGAIKAIEQKGYRVPEDVAVIGFDDLYLSSLIKPPLTAIHQPVYDLGATAVQMVIERIQGKAPQGSRKVILSGELVIRKSTLIPQANPNQ